MIPEAQSAPPMDGFRVSTDDLGSTLTDLLVLDQLRAIARQASHVHRDRDQVPGPAEGVAADPRPPRRPQASELRRAARGARTVVRGEASRCRSVPECGTLRPRAATGYETRWPGRSASSARTYTEPALLALVEIMQRGRNEPADGPLGCR
jgi:hypothetical protein